MLMMNTGHTQVGRPSMGSWLTYGLGTENKNLPGYVVLCPGRADDGRAAAVEQRVPAGGASGHLHRRQGREARPRSSARTSIRRSWSRYINNEKFTLTEQRRELDLLAKLDRMQMRARADHDPQLEAAIQSMEVAYRMQTEAPEVFDIRKESEATLEAVRRRAAPRAAA